MAGAIGVDPRPFTAYEISVMYDGAQSSLWTAISSVSFYIVSSVADVKKKKIKPEDFNWYAKAKQKK